MRIAEFEVYVHLLRPSRRDDPKSTKSATYSLMSERLVTWLLLFSRFLYGC